MTGSLSIIWGEAGSEETFLKSFLQSSPPEEAFFYLFFCLCVHASMLRPCPFFLFFLPVSSFLEELSFLF